VHPAFSVIFLTTLIGTAQGLLLSLFGAEVVARFGHTVPADKDLFAVGGALCVVLGGLGLIASFFHLGRPERAWRSAARWRTSWLSREVIVLPVFVALAALYALAHWEAWSVTFVVGALASLFALALFVCTGMIYACLRFLQEWSTPLTVVNYTVLGSASGATLAAALSALLAPEYTHGYAVLAIAVTLLGFGTRSWSLLRNARLRHKSTVQTAIGVRHPKIVQKSQGFMGGSFNTREFFHGRSPGFLRHVRSTFLAGAFVVPTLLLIGAIATTAAPLLLAAFVVQFGGLVAERWYFFAEANHPQNLYYQAIA
jgi:DMSO reductase anchor subunit